MIFISHASSLREHFGHFLAKMEKLITGSSGFVASDNASALSMQPVNSITLPVDSLAAAVYVLHINAAWFKESQQLRLNR